MDALLAGLGIELKVETELNDHETIRLMVQQGVGASILPHASVARGVRARPGRGAPHDRDRHFPHAGAWRRASRNSSVAREAVAQTVTKLVGDYAAEGRLSKPLPLRGRGRDAKRRG